MQSNLVAWVIYEPQCAKKPQRALRLSNFVGLIAYFFLR